MSNLLIPCEPLQVLPSLAKAIGLNEAIFLQQLHYWLARSKHEHDGRVWVYNTFEEWQTQFPFWSLRTMQRIAASLVKRKLLLVHKFNAKDWDRKNWYSINYEALSLIDTDHAKLSSSITPRWRSLDHAKVAGSYKDQEITTETTIKKALKRSHKPPEPEILIDPPFHGKDFMLALTKYETVKKEIKSPLTPTSREVLYCKLAKFDEETATLALEEAAAGGYKGVFPSKAKGNGNGKFHEQPYTGPVQSVPDPIKENCPDCRGSGTVHQVIDGVTYGMACKHQGKVRAA